MRLSEKAWRLLLTRLGAGEVPDDQIGPTIVRLAKPFEEARVLAATDTTVRFLQHPDHWARHEAMWFVRWAKLLDYVPALIRALQEDPEPDNRSYAAVCLAHLLMRTSDQKAIHALQKKVLNDSEEQLVRLNCYGALLEIASNRPGSIFFSGSASLEDVDFAWVRTLP